MQLASVQNRSYQQSYRVKPIQSGETGSSMAFYRTMQSISFGRNLDDLKEHENPLMALMWKTFDRLVTQVTPSALGEKQNAKYFNQEVYEKKCLRLEQILDDEQKMLKSWSKSPGDVTFLRGPEDGLPERLMIATVKGSKGLENHKPIAILVHNDIVALDIEDPFREIKTTVVPNDKKEGRHWYTSSSETTLGADNKSGVAAGLTAMHYYLQNPEQPHPPIQMIFISDEEHGSESLKQLDTTKFIPAKLAIVPDNDRSIETFSNGLGGTTAGEVTISGLQKHLSKPLIQGHQISISMEGFLGGHSGFAFSDDDPVSLASRLSASDKLAQLKDRIDKALELKGLSTDSVYVENFSFGANAHNQIPQTSQINLIVQPPAMKIVEKEIESLKEEINQELRQYRELDPALTEQDIPNVKIQLKKESLADHSIDLNQHIRNEILLAITQKMEASKGRGQQPAPVENVVSLKWNPYRTHLTDDVSTLNFYMRAGSDEDRLRGKSDMHRIVEEIEGKYRENYPNISVNLNLDHRYPVWKSPLKAKFWLDLAKEVAAKITGKPIKESAGLGAAFPNILALKRNMFGEDFQTLMVGIINPAMHKADERADVDSQEQLTQWMIDIIGKVAETPKLLELRPDRQN